MNLEMNPGAKFWKLTFGTERYESITICLNKMAAFSFTFWIKVVLDVPHCVGIPGGWIAGYFLLLKAPLRKRFSAAGDYALHEIVIEFHFGCNRMYQISFSSPNNFNPPYIIGISSPILKGIPGTTAHAQF